MALLPSLTQIPAQRVPLNEQAKDPSYLAREWYRFFDALHTYTPTPAVFTPAITPITNVAVLTVGGCFYNQMGSVITLTGSFTLEPTYPGDTAFRMTPPVLDTLSLSIAAGTFIVTTAGRSDVGAVYAVSNTLEFRVNTVNAIAATYVFNVNYQIV